MPKLTIEEIKASSKTFLTPLEISGVLSCDPQSIRVMGRQAPEMLGFPFSFSGCRMKIPRVSFLRFIGLEVDDEPNTPNAPDPHNGWELVAAHTLKKEDAGMLWEISVKGWKRQP